MRGHSKVLRNTSPQVVPQIRRCLSWQNAAVMRMATTPIKTRLCLCHLLPGDQVRRLDYRTKAILPTLTLPSMSTTNSHMDMVVCTMTIMTITRLLLAWAAQVSVPWLSILEIRTNNRGRLVEIETPARDSTTTKMAKRLFHKPTPMTEGQVALEEQALANHGHTWMPTRGRAWTVRGLEHEVRLGAKSTS